MLKKLLGIFKRKKTSPPIDNIYGKFITFLIENDVLHDFSIALSHSRDVSIYVYVDKYKYKPHFLIEDAFNWEATSGGVDMWKAIDRKWLLELLKFLQPAKKK